MSSRKLLFNCTHILYNTQFGEETCGIWVHQGVLKLVKRAHNGWRQVKSSIHTQKKKA